MKLYWSRVPGKFVGRESGKELKWTDVDGNPAQPTFTGTISEWYETLAETINDVARHNGECEHCRPPTKVIMHPRAAIILECLAGFQPVSDRKGPCPVKIGTLGRVDVIVNHEVPLSEVTVMSGGDVLGEVVILDMNP